MHSHIVVGWSQRNFVARGSELRTEAGVDQGTGLRPRGRFLSARDVLAIALVFAVGAIVFIRYVPLDPDFHHDGIQFAPGIAILDGLRIHSEAFTPYGPVTNWVQALLLELFGRTVIVLRWQTALSLVVSGVLLYCIMRTYKVGPLVAASVSTLWLVTCPSWSQRDGVFAFWSLPSALLLVFLLGGFLLFRLSETTYRDSAKTLLLFFPAQRSLWLFLSASTTHCRFCLAFSSTSSFANTTKSHREMLANAFSLLGLQWD